MAPPSQVLLPVDHETGRPRGFAFVEFLDRTHAEDAIQRFNGRVFNGRPLAVSEARAREDRGTAPRAGGPAGSRSVGLGPRPPSSFGTRPSDPAAIPTAPRSSNFGPDARPQRGSSQKAKKKNEQKPRGPIPVKTGSRSYSLDDDSPDEVLPDFDDFATSKPTDDKEKDDKEKDNKEKDDKETEDEETEDEKS